MDLPNPLRPPLFEMPEPDFESSRLSNGLTVTTFPMPWLHEVGVTLIVRAGSRFEHDDEAGIAHFLEHMVFKGTARIPDPTALHAYLEAMAADMNAATGQESNAYWITLPPEYLNEGMDIFCEIFTRPALNGLETERKVILAEMREDENDQGEITNPVVLSSARLWSGHPLARSVLGEKSTINRFTSESLSAYLKRHYTGANMAIAFFGPIRHEQSVALAQRSLGEIPAGVPTLSPPPPPMALGPHWEAVDDQSSQFSLSLFFRCPGYREPDYHPASALRRLLDDGFSSRLQATVREKQGLVYDVWAALTAFADTGALEIGASVSPDNLEEVFTALLRELDRLQREPPPPEEWERVLARWRVSLVTCLDRPNELIERYVADDLFDARETLTAAWESALALDPQALPAAARRLTSPSQLVVVLVGPQAKRSVNRLKEIFKSWSARLGGPPSRPRRSHAPRS